MVARTRAPVGFDLKVAARDYTWLLDRESGISVQEIALRAGVTRNAVKAGLRRARAWDRPAAPVVDAGVDAGVDAELRRRALPLFPIGSFTPHSLCPHDGPIPDGSGRICMVCHNACD